MGDVDSSCCMGEEDPIFDKEMSVYFCFLVLVGSIPSNCSNVSCWKLKIALFCPVIELLSIVDGNELCCE